MAKVEYEKPAADLHTELFAKIPFPLAGNTLSDRMASSVMQILGLIRCGSLWLESMEIGSHVVPIDAAVEDWI